MKNCLAIVLAGGKGTRLKELTETKAKPVVPFGGKYRMIDFTLSNCKNSGIDTVGVLTHHLPDTLKQYIEDGKHWNLDILIPPHLQGETEGTARAVYQNISFIEKYQPKYVLILSSDHVYKMDYSKMLKEHMKSGADATIAAIDVKEHEAKQFGILDIVKDSGRILDFEEKPKKPKSTLASMGVYIFNWKKLKNYLTLKNNDFAKDVIPKMLDDHCKLFAYQFKGYWKDVGTIHSLWEAHMDLLFKNNPIMQFDDWNIYTKKTSLPPSFLDEGAIVQKSLISEGCRVFGNVHNSVLFPGVIIEEGANVKDSVLFPFSIIGKNATITRSIIGDGAIIESNVTIGNYPFGDVTLIGNDRIVLDEITA
jgi:glucose-1-phosphate adenylyltransferase